MDPLLASLPTLVWAIFSGAAMLVIALGALLSYHWFRYAMNPTISFTALVIYASVTFFLLASLLIATLAIA